MYCPNCGELIEPGEIYCTQCGTRVVNEEPKRTKFAYKDNKDQKDIKGNKSNKRAYGLKDLMNNDVPGSKPALFGLVLAALSLFTGETALFTAFASIILLVIARFKGFRSTWIWVGVLVSCVMFIHAESIHIYKSNIENSLFFGNLFSFLGLFF